jgi:PIN domain nuclease of toxin-antitoxin system
VRLLLDTQLVLWWLNGDPSLPKQVEPLVMAPGNQAYVSKASLWEMAIKRSLGKLDADLPRIVEEIPAIGMRYLDIQPEHVLKLAELPTFDDHKDPFDRMLVAQSLAEPLMLLTTDSKLGRYGATIRQF